jgi:transcriptional regulator GlxA family with amidase domain
MPKLGHDKLHPFVAETTRAPSVEAISPKTVGLIVFEQMTAADLTGPAEVFSQAKASACDDREFRCYQLLTLGIGTAPCVTECGIIVKPQLDIEDAPPLDTLIVSGGSGIHDARLNKRIAKWLSCRAPVTRRIATLGNGIYALAVTGLLDWRQVTTHWQSAKDVALRFPKLRITPNTLFVKDGPFYTCAGGTSAVDLSLSLIEEDYGRRIALKLARELVLHLKRSGEQEQYSDSLQFQVQSCDRFADLPAWILCNLTQDLSVEALARKACMSPRNFARVFKDTFGKAPAEFVVSARISEARRRLRVPRNSIESVANSVGFQRTDVFSRAFERQVGCRPSTYRARLGITPENGFLKRCSDAIELSLTHA